MSEQHPERILHTRTFTVPPRQAPERIDRFLTHSIAYASRNKVQEAITAGAVTVNGATTKANYRVQPGDDIQISVMKEPPIELVPEDIPLEIAYEDDDVLVVNKPAGMVTHPAYGNRNGTLVNAVLYHVGADILTTIDVANVDDDEGDSEDSEFGLGEESIDYAATRPGVVHRLDKDTSGLMVVAKNMNAKTMLGHQFADRTIKREYYAVAWGTFNDDSGEIEGNIARDRRDRKKFAVAQREGKYALTRYRVVERFEFTTLLALQLATGRTHQIRVHCAHIGRPIFGDDVYGGAQAVYPGAGGKHKQRVANLLKIMPRQALHAKTLGFAHPATGAWMEFDSELPEDIQQLIGQLRQS